MYLHPAGNAACSLLISEHHGTWSVGAPVEDTISALHLITHGIPSRYPRMKILNSHLGGALPMLIQRMDSQLPWEAPKTPEKPSVAARRIVVRLLRPRPAARAARPIRSAPTALVLGTDFPYETGAVFERAVSYITTAAWPRRRRPRALGDRRGALQLAGSVTSLS